MQAEKRPFISLFKTANQGEKIMKILQLKHEASPYVRLELSLDEIRQLKNALYEGRGSAASDYSEIEAQICGIFDLLSYGKLQKDTVQKYTGILRKEEK